MKAPQNALTRSSYTNAAGDAMDVTELRRRQEAMKLRTPPGYAGPPHSGPLGERCKSCASCLPTSCKKSEFVCDLAPGRIDRPIRADTPACHKWKPAT